MLPIQQSAVGMQDLGQLYHDSIKDSHGTLVFCTVRHLKSFKSVSALNVKWVPITKLKERKLSSISKSYHFRLELLTKDFIC